MEQLKSRIEAVLFTTAKALSIKEIAEILGEEDVEKTQPISSYEKKKIGGNG